MNNKRICGNCFDVLRLFAALSVMIGHFVRYYPLYSGGAIQLIMKLYTQ